MFNTNFLYLLASVENGVEEVPEKHPIHLFSDKIVSYVQNIVSLKYPEVQ